MSLSSEFIPTNWVTVTPSNTDDHNLVGFRVGTTAGDVAVVTQAGATTVFPSVQVGETIMGHFVRIRSTGTTAVGITGAKP